MVNTAPETNVKLKSLALSPKPAPLSVRSETIRIKTKQSAEDTAGETNQLMTMRLRYL